MHMRRLNLVFFVILGLSGFSCSEDESSTFGANQGDNPQPADTSASTDAIPDEADSHDASDLQTDAVLGDADRNSEVNNAPVSNWGPHNVGYTNFQLSYDALNGASRTIKVHIWYPTDALEGETVLYDFLAVDELALGQAAPRLPEQGDSYPVLVHSHGHMAFGSVSYTLMDYFASHGWVAVAPDHTGNQPGIARKTSIYYHRSGDISAVIDALEEGHPSIVETFGDAWFRTDQVAMSGHSFGVFTCWSVAGALMDAAALEESCTDGSLSKEGGCTPEDTAILLSDLRDERVAASIMMDGSIRRSFYGSDGHVSVEIPLLTMGGSGPTGHAKGVATQYESLSGLDVTFLDFKGACHEHFGLKECNFSDDRLPEEYGLSTWDDLMDFDEAYRVIGTYALAYSRHYVLDDDSPSILAILSGETTVSDNVVFQRRFETD
jgi:predicted dienelactone hydrolase